MVSRREYNASILRSKHRGWSMGFWNVDNLSNRQVLKRWGNELRE